MLKYKAEMMLIDTAISLNCSHLITAIYCLEQPENSCLFSLEGIKALHSKGKMIVLKSDNLYSVNSFEQPQNIAPQESELEIKGKKIPLNLSPYSLTVLRIKMKQ